MIGRALSDGVRTAARRPGLVVLLWAWNLALGLVVTVPFWTWIARASAVSPQTDVLLDGADIGIITQLVLADAAVVPALAAAAAAVLALSLVSGAFLAGGVLEVALDEGDGPLLPRFFGGAGRFFGRFLRLLLIAGVALLVVAGGTSALLSAAIRQLADAGREAQAFWASMGARVVVGLVVAFFMLVLDYARAITVVTGQRGMFRAFWRSVLFVTRRTAGVGTMAMLAGVAFLATVAACAAFDVAFTARSWTVIVGAVALQQAAALTRSAVRVGHASAQASYTRGLRGAETPGSLPADADGRQEEATPQSADATSATTGAPETLATE